jgi:hypothetical protein
MDEGRTENLQCTTLKSLVRGCSVAGVEHDDRHSRRDATERFAWSQPERQRPGRALGLRPARLLARARSVLALSPLRAVGLVSSLVLMLR